MSSIDLADVGIALSGEGGPLRWYLDTETGSTLLLNAEYEPSQNNGITAAQVEADSKRFRRIPTGDVHLTLTDMGAFAEATTDPKLKESLEFALAAPHPERRFRAVLGWLPEELAKWHAFRQGALEQRARQWLKKIGLEP